MKKPQNQKSPPKLGGNPGSAFGLAIAISALLFLLLPFAQFITSIAERTIIDIDSVELQPPPPPPPEPPPPEEEEQREDIEDMEEQREPPPLDMLELALSTDIGDGAGTGYTLPSFDVGGSLRDIIFEVEDLDEPPTPIYQVGPDIPPHQRPRRAVTFSLVFIVDEQGRVLRPRVERSDAPALDEYVVRAVERWRFEPGRVDGEAVRTRVRQPFNVRP